MSLQDQIDQQYQDPDMPLADICVSGSGSFHAPKGARICVRGGSPTLSGNDGSNEISFVDCDSVTVSGFQDGVLRFERCSSIEQINCSARTTLHVSGSSIQQAQLTSAQGVLINCQIQQATLENCDLHCYKNQYEQLTLKGGRFCSEQEQIQQLTTSGAAKVVLIQPTLQGTCQLGSGVVTISNATGSGQLTLQDTNLIDQGGQYQQLTSSGDQTTLVMRETKIQSKCSIEDGSAHLYSVSIQSQFDVQNCSIVAVDLTCQGQASFQDSEVVLDSPSFQSQISLQGCATRIVDAECQGQVQITYGALESDQGSYQGQFTASGCTLTSREDEFQGQLNATGLLAHNVFWKSQLQGQATLEGDQKTSTLYMVDCQPQQLTVQGFLRTEMLSVQPQQLTCNDLDMLMIYESTLQQFNATQVDTMVLDSTEVQKGTWSSCGTIISDQGQLSQVTISQCGQALLGTSTVSNLTGSQIQFLVLNGGQATLNNCAGFTNGTTITGGNNLLCNTGGNLTLTASVVSTLGGQVANTQGGLSLGSNFDPSQSSGAVSQQGNDMTIRTNMGDIDIIAAGHVNITSQI